MGRVWWFRSCLCIILGSLGSRLMTSTLGRGLLCLCRYTVLSSLLVWANSMFTGLKYQLCSGRWTLCPPNKTNRHSQRYNCSLSFLVKITMTIKRSNWSTTLRNKSHFCILITMMEYLWRSFNKTVNRT